MKIRWKKTLSFVSTIALAFVVGHAMLAASSAQEEKAKKKGDNGPIALPDHQYDLPATHVSAAQIQWHLEHKMIQGGKPNGAAVKDDDPIDMVDMGGPKSKKHQVGISVVTRFQGQENDYAVHDDVAEVYYFIYGSGTMLLGGKLVNPERRGFSPGNGMGLSAKEATGYQTIPVNTGDMLIIPAGTPHKFQKANTWNEYIVVRLDPDGITPLLDNADKDGGFNDMK